MNNSPSESWHKCLKISFRVNLKNSSNDCMQVKSMETSLQPGFKQKNTSLVNDGASQDDRKRYFDNKR
jgi:hypothetical protein